MKLDYKRIWISNNEVRTWNYREGKLSGKTRTIYNVSGGIISSAYKKNGRWVELDMLSINSVVQNRCNSPVLVGTQTLGLDLKTVLPEQTSILIVEPSGFISKPIDVLHISARTGDWSPQMIPFKI